MARSVTMGIFIRRQTHKTRTPRLLEKTLARHGDSTQQTIHKIAEKAYGSQDPGAAGFDPSQAGFDPSQMGAASEQTQSDSVDDETVVDVDFEDLE